MNGLSSSVVKKLQGVLSPLDAMTVCTVESLIECGRLPADLPWEPSLCLSTAQRVVLVHVLASARVPSYLQKALARLKPMEAVEIALLARETLIEGAEDEAPPTRVSAAKVASEVASDAVAYGCALLFEESSEIYSVFTSRFALPKRCRSQEETGHIPSWLYQDLAGGEMFSDALSRLFKSFSAEYAKATRRGKILYERETEILMRFAKRFAALDKRLYLAIDGLKELGNAEKSGAFPGRDHFFHTFNNLFLGFCILGRLANKRNILADVDRFIEGNSKAKIRGWEALWFLTCVSHDPGYVAEKFWPNVGHSLGINVVRGADRELPEEVKADYRNIWDSEFGTARRELRSLYLRVARKWKPGRQPHDSFDDALKSAYFDGRRVSHSLMSGFKLITQCQSKRVQHDNKFEPLTALAACEIAALCMMFHDPQCRETLQANGIPPVPFEVLPYAALLMYVDALQDDRRDISVSRFRKHGVLNGVEVANDGRQVAANVCLREVAIAGWPFRIREYASVMSWINSKSSTKFMIDHKTSLGLI